ncbi:ComEC/Rec2 family competence protein [Paraburkholderia caribensis]|uniref:ComEC/Rec2 family competence protein n=1 Tax=Paraburkholderia caribensis TaxID=75105 RepID=UPI001D073D7F|nr:hypothetical protein [Paraburkholderia caribensis]
MKMSINALQVKHGDSIVIEIEWATDKVFRILVDGGPPGVIAKINIPALKSHQAKALTSTLDSYRDAGLSFDLTVLTHIDSDHIGGLLAAYKREDYRRVLGTDIWFNSARLIASELTTVQSDGSNFAIDQISGPETSVKQAADLDDLLDELKPNRRLVIAGQQMQYEWGTIDILSPTSSQLKELAVKWEMEVPSKETSNKGNDYHETLEQLQTDDEFSADTSVPNASSIAFLIKSEMGTALLLGDALSQTVSDSLRALGYSESNRLAVDICKLSHHGSKGNTCSEFLSLVEVRNFIISTNGSNQLPDKRTIARILQYCPSSKITFNYPDLLKKIFHSDELENYCTLLNAQSGAIVAK